MTNPHHDILQKSPLAFGLSAPHITTLADFAVLHAHADHELIVEEASDGIYILKQGVVVVEKGNTILETLKEPGDFFGEMSLIDLRPHSAHVRSQGKCETLVILKADLVTFCSRYEDAHLLIIFNITRTLSARLRKANDRIVQLLLAN